MVELFVCIPDGEQSEYCFKLLIRLYVLYKELIINGLLIKFAVNKRHNV